MTPAVALASGWAIGLASEIRLVQSRMVILAAAVTLFVIPVWVNRDYFLERSPSMISRNHFSMNPFPESPELSKYLASNTSLNDRVFIFGSEPQILFQAERKSATPFVMIYPLTREYPRYQEFQNQVWQDISGALPAFILVVNVPTSVLWDGNAELTLAQRLETLIQSRYRLEAVMPIHPVPGRLIISSGEQSAVRINNTFDIRVYRLASTS
jgi:hypothetical protein